MCDSIGCKFVLTCSLVVHYVYIYSVCSSCWFTYSRCAVGLCCVVVYLTWHACTVLVSLLMHMHTHTCTHTHLSHVHTLVTCIHTCHMYTHTCHMHTCTHTLVTRTHTRHMHTHSLLTQLFLSSSQGTTWCPRVWPLLRVYPYHSSMQWHHPRLSLVS